MQETIGLQLDLFESKEFNLLMKEIIDIRRSQDKTRKKLFQEVGELQKKIKILEKNE